MMEDQAHDGSYRMCAECGRDHPPEPSEADGHLRIGFACFEHGVHSVVSPFED